MSGRQAETRQANIDFDKIVGDLAEPYRKSTSVDKRKKNFDIAIKNAKHAGLNFYKKLKGGDVELMHDTDKDLRDFFNGKLIVAVRRNEVALAKKLVEKKGDGTFTLKDLDDFTTKDAVLYLAHRFDIGQCIREWGSSVARNLMRVGIMT